MSNVHITGSVPSPGMSRYSFTDSNGYRVGPVIEAATALEARARVVGITGLEPRYCTHLSDYHSMTAGAALPDPGDYYDHLFAQDT